jgi:hypothetical protein
MASFHVIRLRRVGVREMTDSPSTPSRPPAPKRGAFPTPKSEIDRAQPYVPDDPAEGVDAGRTPAEGEDDAET